MPEVANGNSVGIIFPPPDVQGVIDKTAQFVAKSGPAFEQRVLKEQNNTKFAFLLPGNPYRAYYEMKVKEAQTGVVMTSKPAVPQAIMDQKRAQEEKQKKKEQLKMLTMGEKKELKEPEPDVFTVPPAYILPLDQDIIKLTAQFVARNGQKFLLGLTQREEKNPMYDFLKPSHTHFGHFTALVDAYTKCLMPSKTDVERLKKNAEDRVHILERCLSRFSWEDAEMKKARQKEEVEQKEREQMAQIDWHDFVPVEMIEFTAEDESLQLAAPIDPKTGTAGGVAETLDQSMHDELRKDALADALVEEVEMDVDEEIEMDEPEADEVEMDIDDENEPESKDDKEEDMTVEQEEAAALEEEDLPPQEEVVIAMDHGPIKVRHDYVREKKKTGTAVMQKCPITGQMVPADEMSAHLRKVLIDPQWVEQRNKLLDEAGKETAFADDVESNLSAFVAKRPDLFGTIEEQIEEAQNVGAEAAAREAGADSGPVHSIYNPSVPAPATGRIMGSAMPPAPPMGAPPAPATPGMILPGGLALGPQSAVVPHVAAGDSDSDDEPVSKMARTDAGPGAIPEAHFLAKHPGKLHYIIQVLGGVGAQTVQLDMEASALVSKLKEAVASHVTSIPLARMRLRTAAGQTLKNACTLAFYNLGTGTVLELVTKERGGRKK